MLAEHPIDGMITATDVAAAKRFYLEDQGPG